ncbi:MAG: archaemetzincin family Zn-dependent metalloprotease [Thermococcus sp.]|uniref:archaemetzincin family Zn-dependent metalloprotease n=1 Tax=Thermococcus sp. TaxID=35749 RepID=UPI001D4DDD41|nr:archaemetzincin family Zn-dependent metalloprotease [Thermococcus sp.]MBO8174668.1 archaemetzincin family Zn-dependent metalloprotease [Thermococcus sp.]
MAGILVIPIVAKEVERDVIRAIVDYVRQFYSKFGLGVTILPKMSIRRFSAGYNEIRGQFLGRTFLPILGMIRSELRAKAILGITDVDLYEEGLNFIFGLASPYLKAAIISLYRLKPEFYGERNRELLIDRSIKEAMHELGHVFGLDHCPNPKCVMHFSNSIIDTDFKGRDYCDKCIKKLEVTLG